jgi:hypothetical protein
MQALHRRRNEIDGRAVSDRFFDLPLSAQDEGFRVQTKSPGVLSPTRSKDRMWV